MIFHGLVLLASKSSCRFGDGLAQTALWKYWLPDFLLSGHVSDINIKNMMTKMNKLVTKLALMNMIPSTSTPSALSVTLWQPPGPWGRGWLRMSSTIVLLTPKVGHLKHKKTKTNTTQVLRTLTSTLIYMWSTQTVT